MGENFQPGKKFCPLATFYTKKSVVVDLSVFLPFFVINYKADTLYQIPQKMEEEEDNFVSHFSKIENTNRKTKHENTFH